MTEFLVLPDSQQLTITLGVACFGLVAVLVAKRGALLVFAAVCAVVPVAIAAAAADGTAPGYLWMLSPADQARHLVELAVNLRAQLALGSLLTAALALVFAAALAWRLSTGAVDRWLGRGARGAVALAAPVVVIAACAAHGALRADPAVVGAVAAAAWAGVAVAVASFSARARVAPDGAVLHLGAVTLFGVFALLAVAFVVASNADAAFANDLASATALGGVVVAVGGAAALLAGDPDQQLRSAPRRNREPAKGGLVVVGAIFVVVGAAVVVRAGLVPLPLLSLPKAQTEPLWPSSVNPRLVREGEGRSPDVIVFEDGTYSAVPQNDDDVPAILLDVAADPQPLLLALRALGHEHALLVGPRDDGSLGGIYVDTADVSLASVAVAHAR